MYVARTGCDPAVNAGVWICAVWPDSATGLPIGEPSRKNWTVPDGTVDGVVVFVTVAVSVAVCPWTGGLDGGLTVVAVASAADANAGATRKASSRSPTMTRPAVDRCAAVLGAAPMEQRSMVNLTG
jgi:hypothetical protein